MNSARRIVRALKDRPSHLVADQPRHTCHSDRSRSGHCLRVRSVLPETSSGELLSGRFMKTQLERGFLDHPQDTILSMTFPGKVSQGLRSREIKAVLGNV